MPAIARIHAIVLDCPDPHALATFYAQLGGGTPRTENDGWVVLNIPEGPTLAFQHVPAHTPPEWPRADRNSQQFHLDFDAGRTWEEVDAAQEKVLALGARPLDLEDDGKDFRVYADPAGHPFCLCLVDAP